MRRLQFRLRTLLALLLLAAVVGAIAARPVRRGFRESATLRQLSHRGVLMRVQYAGQRGSGQWDAPSWSDFARSWLNPVASVRLYGHISAADVATLAAFEALRQLELSNCQIDPAAFAELRRLPALEELDLSYSAVTDEQLGQLASCKRLRAVHLSNSGVSDEGVAALTAALGQLNISDD